MDRRRCHKGQRGRFYLKDLCGNGTCESLVVVVFLFQLAIITPQINLMGYDTAAESLVFQAVLSSLMSNMVLFGCIGILCSKAYSKLKQSTVSGAFLESKLHSILKPCSAKLASECL